MTEQATPAWSRNFVAQRRRMPEVGEAIETVLLDQGRVAFRAYGGSMMPTVWPGCWVEVVRHFHHNLVAGEVVLVRGDSGLVLHRVVDVWNAGFTTRGDCHGGAPEEHLPSALLGRVPGLLVCRLHWPRAPRAVQGPLRRAHLFALPVARAAWKTTREPIAAVKASFERLR